MLKMIIYLIFSPVLAVYMLYSLIQRIRDKRTSGEILQDEFEKNFNNEREEL